MGKKIITVEAGEGRLKVEITAVLTGDGITAALTGGERPHVGGVVMSVPRLSLTGEGKACDTWVAPVAGHKDTEAARPVAEILSRNTGLVTVVTGGIHIDGADQKELDILLANSIAAGQKLAREIAQL